eukprot:scaffold78608_cov51-Phaeocystis_antarctica.AAC.1
MEGKAPGRAEPPDTGGGRGHACAGLLRRQLPRSPFALPPVSAVHLIGGPRKLGPRTRLLASRNPGTKPGLSFGESDGPRRPPRALHCH